MRSARTAPLSKVSRVQLLSSDHLYWSDLDVDLSVESIEHPDRFPLIGKVRSNSRLQGRRLAPMTATEAPRQAVPTWSAMVPRPRRLTRTSVSPTFRIRSASSRGVTKRSTDCGR